jgi:hypothetical protein
VVECQTGREVYRTAWYDGEKQAEDAACGWLNAERTRLALETFRRGEGGTPYIP